MYHGRMEYSEWYARIAGPFRGPGASRALGALDRALVYGFAGAYVVFLVVLFATGNGLLLRGFAVPAVTFALVTALRLLINRPRPYEAHGIQPIIAKDTQGKSLPSRHMASATIIAFAFFQAWPVVGIVLFFGCALIAFTRIVGGVHYPTDIVAAVAISLICGAIGFFVV